jgi:hypothetical protein
MTNLAVAVLISVLASAAVWLRSAPARRSRNLFLLGLGIFAVIGLAGCAVNYVAAVDELLSVAIGIPPLAASLVAALLPAESTAISAGATLVANGLKALKATVDSYHSNPNDTTLQQVSDGVTAVQQNLDQLAAAAEVKDPASQAKLTAAVSAISVGLGAVEAGIYGKHPATVAAAQASTQ